MITKQEIARRRMALDRKLKGLVNAAVWDHVKKAGLAGVNNPELSGLLASDALTRNYTPISDAQLKRLVMSGAQNRQLGGWWDWASAAGDFISSGAGSVWDAVSGAATGAYDWIRSGIGDVVGNVSDYAVRGWETASDWFGGGQPAPTGNVVRMEPIVVQAEALPFPNERLPNASPVYPPFINSPYSAENIATGIPGIVRNAGIRDAVSDAVSVADMGTANAGLWSKGIDMASGIAQDILKGYVGLEKLESQTDIAKAKSAAIQAASQGGRPYPVPVPVPTRGGSGGGSGGGGGAVPSPRGRPISRGGSGGAPQPEPGLPWPLIAGGGLLAFLLLSDDKGKNGKSDKRKKAA